MDEIDYLDFEPLLEVKIKTSTMTELLSQPYKVFLSHVKMMNNSARLALLNNADFLAKLFILNTPDNIWDFELVSQVYSFKELLPIMQGEFLEKIAHRKDHKSYVYLITFIRYNKAEFMEYLFDNGEFIKFFMFNADAIYSELNFNVDFMIKLCNYCLTQEIPISNLLISQLPYSFNNKAEQQKFLQSIENNDLKVQALFYVAPDVAEDYIKNNALGLTTGQIFNLMTKLTLPHQLYQNKNFFNKQILDMSLQKMDMQLEILARNNNVNYLKMLKKQMLLKILTLYNPGSKTINYEPVERLFEEIEPFEGYLNRFYFLNRDLNEEEKAHRLLSNVVMNLLYGDSIKNMSMNIHEMLSFNGSLKESLLSPEKIKYYERLEHFYEWDTNEIMAFYDEQKKQDLSSEFYDDMRQIKNVAYQTMKDKCLNIDAIASLENKEQTAKFGIPIYKLKGQNFNALVSCQYPQKGKHAHRIRKCFSLISQNNLDVFNEHAIIYGYTNFPPENVIHVLERDALSGDTKEQENSEYVNRIRQNEEILKTKIMNEIQIVNNYDSDRDTYERIKPDYIVCFDEVNNNSWKEAQKKNLPIVVIDRKLYQELDQTEYEHLDGLDIYSPDFGPNYYYNDHKL